MNVLMPVLAQVPWVLRVVGLGREARLSGRARLGRSEVLPDCSPRWLREMELFGCVAAEALASEFPTGQRWR